MNKLIELLNEYGEIRKYNNIGVVEWVEHTKGNLYWKYWENTWSYMVVISKEYGFIKRLVDNDKIDLLRLDNRIALSEFNKVERVLMALSISDTPIDDLIKYLK